MSSQWVVEQMCVTAVLIRPPIICVAVLAALFLLASHPASHALERHVPGLKPEAAQRWHVTVLSGHCRPGLQAQVEGGMLPQHISQDTLLGIHPANVNPTP